MFGKDVEPKNNLDPIKLITLLHLRKNFELSNYFMILQQTIFLYRSVSS